MTLANLRQVIIHYNRSVILCARLQRSRDLQEMTRDLFVIHDNVSSILLYPEKTKLFCLLNKLVFHYIYLAVGQGRKSYRFV